MGEKKDNIIRTDQPFAMNIGMVVFLVFFVYILVNVISYAIRGNLQIYEVGPISNVVQDTTYTGLILREEVVQNTPDAGYVNVYVREGTRTSVGDTVCLLDEKGQYTQIISGRGTGDSSLSNDQLASLKKKLTSYRVGYRSARFSDIYDTKYSLNNQLLGYLGTENLNEIAQMGIDTSFLRGMEAEYSGVVEYYTDGKETLTEDKLTAADLDDSKYEKNLISSGSLTEKNSPAFKTITSEKWVIYLPLSAEDQAVLADQKNVTLLLHDVNLEVKASFSLIHAADDTILGRCELNDYMIQMADKRYATVSIRKSRIPSLNVTGLKIPKSSITTHDFYVVPIGYAAYGGNDTDLGFYRQTPEGTAEFITPSIYAKSENYYYLDKSALDAGTVLMKPAETPGNSAPTDSAATYTIERETTLTGVYNVNKGYALFRAVEILDENEDYYIVEAGRSYGLAIYDHILLNGNKAKDGEIVY